MGKKNKKRVNSSDSMSSSEEKQLKKIKKREKKSKKHEKKSKKKKRNESSESSGSNSEEAGWIVKNIDDKQKKEPLPDTKRDDWMTSADSFMLQTFTKDKAEKKPANRDATLEKYDPATNPRELNPYFRSGEGGLPSSTSQFQRPRDDDDGEDDNNYRRSSYSSASRSSKQSAWKKNKPEEGRRRSRSRSPAKEKVMYPARPTENTISTTSSETTSSSHVDFLTDAQMNEIGAKIIKAEIMGNTKLMEKLTDKLNRAKEYKKNSKNPPQKEQVLLTLPTASGMNRPIKEREARDRHADKKKKKKIETHEGGERTRYYPDDDKHDIKQMFEHEKFSDGRDQDIEFAKAISKVKESQQTDMADIFSDVIRKDKSNKSDERDEAIREAQKMEKILDTCNKCFDSPKMTKELVVYVGKTIYLAIPYHEALIPHHLIISTIQHVPCVTMIDEEIWEEFKNVKKALTKFFFDRNEDVVFFETVKNLHRRPHMEVQMVASKEFETIQFYFKKAIQEAETRTLNKKLVDIKSDKSIRSSIPRGLPYFWIDFGNTGMAHVIENQEDFPSNFAQEIIGGMLNLDVNRWRRPRKELQPAKRTQYFNTLLKKVLESF